MIKHVGLSMQAKANRGILYVDEVNLLDDGLVDVVLDSSASGVNTVEREGVGIVHPAKFIMIGSGNPQARLPNIPHLTSKTLDSQPFRISRSAKHPWEGPPPLYEA